ncbi:vacuolar protein sorting-associated protein [Sarocladium implicatum]|nr:vacuolar protein sorting-associated protein [Sarocladium implicatum]
MLHPSFATSFTRSSSSALRHPPSPTDQPSSPLSANSSFFFRLPVIHRQSPSNRHHGGRATLEVQQARVDEQHLGSQHRCLQRWRNRMCPLPFSVAFYLMLDSAVWSKSVNNASNVHVKFADWLPLFFSSLGMLIINSVEKQRLSSDSWSYSGSGVAWKARVVLFLGFAALAGGMAGGVTVFVLKYVVPSVGMPALGMGIENVLSNLCCSMGQPEHGGRVLVQPFPVRARRGSDASLDQARRLRSIKIAELYHYDRG